MGGLQQSDCSILQYITLYYITLFWLFFFFQNERKTKMLPHKGSSDVALCALVTLAPLIQSRVSGQMVTDLYAIRNVQCQLYVAGCQSRLSFYPSQKKTPLGALFCAVLISLASLF